MTLYRPGTLETDNKKQNMALQQHAIQIDTNTTNIAANTTAIAAINAANVTSIAGNHGAFTLNSTSGITNSTNDIQLQQASSSQFGAVKVDNSTITASAGVISASVNQITGVTPTSSTVTITIASPGVVTWTSHGLAANTPVYFETTGALPTGLTAASKASGTVAAQTYNSNPTLYYVVGSSITTNTFQVATTLANAKAGTSVNTSGTQSGTHTAFANAMAPAGCVGEMVWNVKDISGGTSLGATGTNTVWNSISVTAGVWQVWAQSGVIGTPSGSSTFSCQHMHSNYGVGITSISTSPFNGAAAMHVQTDNANGWIITNPPNQIAVTGTSTINAVMLVDYSAGTAVAYGHLFARRIA